MYPIDAIMTRVLMSRNEILTNTPIKQRHIARHANAYITELNANHSPIESEYNHINTILTRLETTDSVKETRDKIEELIQVWIEVKEELFSMREAYFKVVNENTSSVYGILRKGCTPIDRDNYIKKLRLFHEITQGLRSLDDKGLIRKLGFSPNLLLHHSTGVYGDFMALQDLLEGNPSKVPALEYNKGSVQCG